MTKPTLKQEPLSVGLYSLGCTKNLVDSEVLLGDLLATGEFALSRPEEADILIVNTCGFLEASKRESIETIQAASKFKKEGQCKSVMVIGCMAERNPNEIKDQVPDVDYIVPLSQYQQIPPILQGVAKKCRKEQRREVDIRTKQTVFPEVARFRLTPRHFGYLRISEGCNHKCSFCVIPKIRGKHRSKPIEYLVEEARELVADGAKELNIIADDTTFYGIDLYGESRLADLMRELNEIEGLKWIRLFYAYPTTVNDEIIEAMRDLDKVVPYLDMPIQHISDPILKGMKRGKSARIKEVIQKFRATIPDLTLRTTVIVGFPGETEEDFQELVEFIRETKFKHLGIFTFSPEKGAPSSEYDHQVPEEVKIDRYDRLHSVQRQIVHELNQERIGSTEKVLIDGTEGELFFGRTASDGPEIDNLVWFEAPGQNLQIGDMVEVEVIDAEDFDLVGKVLTRKKS